MIKKRILIIFLTLFLSNCGFSPIYVNNKNINFSIEQVSYTGDRELNNFLKTNLDQYRNEKNDNKIFIETSSIYKKNILSKNKAGEVSDYQIEAEVIFLIKPSNKEVIIAEKKIMKSIDDKFEEARNERSIKQNFASSITQKLASELIINK
jgi:outer membrane lipopolysaccharide assembly protein LptE/RlpB